MRASSSSLLALIALAPTAALADGAVLVLQLEAPSLPAATVSALDESMRQEIAQVLPAKSKLLPRPALDYSGLREAAGCVDDGAKCLQAIGRLVSATQVFRATLEGTAAQVAARFQIVDVATGKLKASQGELADVAPDSGAELRVQVALAFGVKRDTPPGSVGLYVASDVGRLEGAEIFVDGVATKPSDLARIAPGDHTIEVRQTGFEPFSWSGLVRPGRETRVGVAFQPTKSPPPVVAKVPVPASPKPAPPPIAAASPVRRGPNYLLPGLLGAASLATGVIATIHAVRVVGLESDHQETCNVTVNRPAGCGTQLDDPGADCTLGVCEEGRSAATLATVFWIATGALAAGAVTVWLIEGDDADDVATRLTPGLGGGTITVTY